MVYKRDQKPEDADSLIVLANTLTKISYDGLDFIVESGFEEFPVDHGVYENMASILCNKG